MVTFLINLPQQDMQRRLSDALGVYVDAMRYPPGTENQRAAMWLEHTRRRGWQAVAAVEVDAAADTESSSDELRDAPLLGVAYGYCGAPDQWWQQQVVAGLQRSGYPDPEIAKHFARVTFLSDVRAELPRLQTPTLILQCSDDIIAPRAVGEYMTRVMPSATLAMIDNVGHCPHMSAPSACSEAMEAFLAARSPS